MKIVSVSIKTNSWVVHAAVFVAAQVVLFQDDLVVDGSYVAGFIPSKNGLICAFSIRQCFVDLFGESKD